MLARLAGLAEPWPCVAAYEPLRTEPGSVALLSALDEAGVRVLVPVLRADRDLDWAPWTGSGRGLPAGVSAIETASVVFVPALAVDSQGLRLGRGGGSYDRALPRVAAGTAIVALLYDEELLEQVPADPWDVPVTAVVTPSGWRDVASTRS